jgi:hypothetical protein
LTLFNSLITTNPDLRPIISSLLPAPTLSSVLNSLAELERAVVTSIPAGAGIREDYIWGRVRTTLESYVAESKTFLSVICVHTIGGGGGGGEDEIGHPSTTFAFLHALTSSLRRIEALLPSSHHHHHHDNISITRNRQDPLSTHLLPLVINYWHLFITRLSTAVNQEGRIISAGVVRGWFTKLDELCVPSPGVGSRSGEGRREGGAKKACEGTRERLKKEVGWLVGLRPETHHDMRMDGDGHQEDDEEEL